MGLRLFFLPNFPGATFIQGGTFIPDSRVRVTTQLIVPLHLESLAGKYKEYIIDDVVVVMILKYVTSFFYNFFPIFSAWQRT